LSRRAKTLEVPRPHPRRNGEPLHLLVDSTGLRLCGAGEWLLEKHGTKTRRSWRKLHIGLDAGSGQIVAASLTAKEVDDGAEVGPLLDQITGVVASFTGDGGYDQDRIYADVAEHSLRAAVIVPPRAIAVPSETAETAPTQRDRHLQHIAEHGRMAWQKASGYTMRARAEAAIGRFKQVSWGRAALAHGRAARDRGGRRRPRSIAWWSLDARTMSAPPDLKRGWAYCVRSPSPCNTLSRDGEEAMPRGRQLQGEHPLSGAERQARYRARIEAQKTTPVVRYRRPADRRTRPQRWRDAIAELIALQAEYADWAEALPDGLRDSATAEALQAIVDLDVDELAAIEPPRGYGRN